MGVTYRKLILDTVQMKTKHMEMSYGDCRFSRQDSTALKKLTHHPSDGMGPTTRVSGREWLSSRGWSGRYIHTSTFI